MKRRNSLFLKFLVVAMICIIVPLSVTSYFSITSLMNSLEDDAKSSLNATAIEKQNYINLAFKDQMDIATSIANESTTVNYFNDYAKTKQPDENVIKIISDSLKMKKDHSNGLYENMFFETRIDNDSNLLVVADAIAGKSIGKKIPTTPDKLKVIQNNPYGSVGKVMASPTTGRPVITIDSPIIDKETNQLTCVYKSSLDLCTLAQNIIKSNTQSKMKTLLVSQEGAVLCSEKTEHIFKLDISKQKGDLLDLYNQMKSSSSGIAYFTLDGSRNIASFIKSEVTGFFIISYMPVDQYMSRSNNQRNLILIVIAVCLIASAILILLFSHSITKPLKSAVEYIRIFASGDFSREIPEESMKIRDETGELMASLSVMQKSVKALLEALVTHSAEIEASVIGTNKSMEELESQIEEISSTAGELSAGMEETAASTEVMRDSSLGLKDVVSNISEKADEGARTSIEISRRAQMLKENAVNSKKVAEETKNNIYESLKGAIEQSRAVDQINKLTESILQISSQTNLLALNASIEAARAGEAGKGFAVVAAEVGMLAENSKKITGQIQKVTETVIVSVGNLKMSSESLLKFIDGTVINDYISMVKIGEQYYNDANYVEAMVNDFKDNAQNVSLSLNTIVNAINEIAASNNEMAEGTGNIAGKSSAMLQAANELVITAEENKQISEQLKKIASKFKL